MRKHSNSLNKSGIREVLLSRNKTWISNRLSMLIKRVVVKMILKKALL